MADTIWDAITEGQRMQEDRQSRAFDQWAKSQSLDAEIEARRAAARLNNASAGSIERSQQDAAMKAKEQARAEIQDALQKGDVAKADYLSQLHFGQPIKETTQLPQAPAPVADPGKATDPVYGPQLTPGGAAQAKETEVKNNGNLTEQWLALHPDATDLPDTETMLADVKAAASEDQDLKETVERNHASGFAKQQADYGKYQQDQQAYEQGLAQAKARPTYQAGDMRFDPMAAPQRESADMEAAAAGAPPEMSNWLRMVAAAKKANLPTEKAGENYLATAGRAQFDERLETQQAKDAAALERQRLKNEGALAVAGERNKGALDVAKVRGQSKGKGKVDGGMDPKDARMAYNALGTEERTFTKESNYPKLLFQYQKANEAEAMFRSGNPMGTAAAMESFISANRGGAATGAFLKLFQGHSASYGGKLENFIAGVDSGDFGPEAKANLAQVIKEQQRGIQAEANQLKQGWSSGAFANSPEKYKLKGNYEDIHDRLWTPFGFEPIKRDPNAGRVGLLGAEKPKSVKDQLVSGARKTAGKPERSADDRLRALRGVQ